MGIKFGDGGGLLTCAIALGVTVGFLGAVTGASSPAAGQDWQISGIAQGTLGFDDNFQLATSNEEEVFFTILSPELSISRLTERTEIVVTPSVAVGLFNESDFDYFDQYLDISALHRTQLGVLGLNTDVSHEVTTVSELDDTGNLQDRDGRRLRINSRPYFDYTLSPRDTLSVNGRLTKVLYYDAPGLEDFSVYGGGLGYSRQITQRDRVGAQVEYSHFENDDVSGEKSDAVSLEGTWRSDWSERLITRLRAGPRYVRSTDVSATGAKDTNTGFGGVVEAAIDWEANELTDLAATVSRRLNGSGGGQLLVRDRVGVEVDYQAWPTIGFGFDAAYIANERATNNGPNRDRQFVSVTPSVTWSITRDWGLTGSYRFRWQEIGSGPSANSNAVFVTLTYFTPVWHLD